MVTRQLFETRQMDYSPAARDTTETTAIMAVDIGDIIIEAHSMRLILSSTANTMVLGDGGSTNRFHASIDTSAGTVGDNLAGQTAAFPYAYTVADTIDVVYTAVGGGGTTTPKQRFYVTVLRSHKF